jgi:hypoxanthine-DNA glycosylase
MDKYENMQSMDSVIDENCTMMILDVFPNNYSLDKQQYYADTQTLFWHIIIRVLNKSLTHDDIEKLSYQKKIQILLNNKIALGYVFQQRNNHSPLYNDFETFFTNYPNIKTLFFHGKNAMLIFNKKYKKLIEKLHIKEIALPPASQQHGENIFKRLSVWQKTISQIISIK